MKISNTLKMILRPIGPIPYRRPKNNSGIQYPTDHYHSMFFVPIFGKFFLSFCLVSPTLTLARVLPVTAAPREWHSRVHQKPLAERMCPIINSWTCQILLTRWQPNLENKCFPALSASHLSAISTWHQQVLEHNRLLLQLMICQRGTLFR